MPSNLPLTTWTLMTSIASLLLASCVVSEVHDDSNLKYLNENSKKFRPVNEPSLHKLPDSLDKSRDNHFDFIMFTQLWPISSCIEWKEREDDHTCILNRKSKLTGSANYGFYYFDQGKELTV